MTEVDPMTKESVEQELRLALQSANLEFANLTHIMGSAIGGLLMTYSAKQKELIGKCGTMEEVHEILGLNQLPSIPRCCGTEGE